VRNGSTIRKRCSIRAACARLQKRWKFTVTPAFAGATASRVASRNLPNYFGWRWALDGDRIASPERLLGAAVAAFHTHR
jgi:hypothetical protein